MHSSAQEAVSCSKIVKARASLFIGTKIALFLLFSQFYSDVVMKSCFHGSVLLGNYVEDSAGHDLLDVVLTTPALQSYAVHKLFFCLREGSTTSPVLCKVRTSLAHASLAARFALVHTRSIPYKFHTNNLTCIFQVFYVYYIYVDIKHAATNSKYKSRTETRIWI